MLVLLFYTRDKWCLWKLIKTTNIFLMNALSYFTTHSKLVFWHFHPSLTVCHSTKLKESRCGSCFVITSQSYRQLPMETSVDLGKGHVPLSCLDLIECYDVLPKQKNVYPSLTVRALVKCFENWSNDQQMLLLSTGHRNLNTCINPQSPQPWNHFLFCVRRSLESSTIWRRSWESRSLVNQAWTWEV